ncbi:MAG TPA: Na+/H+ antiporter [Kofleriaceae bacterium]|jgi:CPA1 family monovalent cation:H+ antiporter|nr:Na+/H+ antiporter [Kofleriaceae bacterium]
MATTIASLQTLLLLGAVLVVVALAAERLRLAPPILMVIAGIAMAMLPGLPRFELSPEFVLLFVLPPVIYSAGVSMSWREFRFNLRPIGLLAIGGVVFTTCALAVALHYVLGLDWALGFLLGAIVSPPDAVAPIAIAHALGVPRRILVVLEGEGLVNDAAALVIYRFAVAAIATGAFSLARAVGVFWLILAGEIVYGILIGAISLRLRRWAHSPRAEIALSLMTPYAAFWLPEHLGGSGVLAAAATGLYVSWRGPLQISAATRLQGIFFWDLTIYLIDGMVFLYTGLQMRMLIERIHVGELQWMLLATVLTTAIAIAARFLWAFPVAYVPRWISKRLAARDPAPRWQTPFMIAFTGVRGVVSLAAALAIPITTGDGRPFPHRDAFLFIAFGVIVITLIGQGLSLPRLIRWLGLGRGAEEERQRELAQQEAARAQVLEIAAQALEQIAAERNLPDHVVHPVRLHLEHERGAPREPGDVPAPAQSIAELRTELIGEQRLVLHQLLRDGQLSDESRRRLERELDLEEEALRHRTDLAL